MSKLLGRLFGRAEPNNNNNFTLKQKYTGQTQENILNKARKTAAKLKINHLRRHQHDKFAYIPYGNNHSLKSLTYVHETNNPLVPHTPGRKLYIACVDEKYDIASSLIDDIINMDKTQLDYIGENGTPLIALAHSIVYYSDTLQINSPDSKAKVEECILLIKKLINAGANIDIHSHEFIRNMTVISLFIDFIEKVSPTVYNKLSEIIRLLLNKGANLNIIDDYGRTTLDNANESGKSDLAGEIFAKGGRTSEDIAPQLFETCLGLREKALLTISEIDKKRLGMMLLLECNKSELNISLILTYISEGADVNMIIKNDWINKDKTPLLLICSRNYMGSQEMLANLYENCDKLGVILIKAGANLDMLDRDRIFPIDAVPGSGWSALMYSISNSYYNTTLALIEYGANLNIVFKSYVFKDETALDMAIERTKRYDANEKLKANSLVKLIREKGGRTAKELSGTVANWKEKPAVKRGGGYRRKTRKHTRR